jgi:hypothetical protein
MITVDFYLKSEGQRFNFLFQCFVILQKGGAGTEAIQAWG